MKAHRPYTLKEYDPKWKEIFRSVAEEIKPILGENMVEVEHIGSTSIEGMVAKPQVDVLVVVKNLDIVKESIDALTHAGFTSHGRGYVTDDDEYFSKDVPDGRRIVSVHILQKDNPKITEFINFRDYLRTHKEDRDFYIKTKRDSYDTHHDNYTGYEDGKRDVIRDIKEKAKHWASSTSQNEA